MAKTNQNIIINGREFNMRSSDFTVNLSPVHISDKMTGKMKGIPSISTCCSVNPICLARMQDGNSVCSKCFAETTMKMKPTVRAAMESNYYLLTESVLEMELLPRFGNVRIVRIESFGDVANVTQAINYINIIKVNPDVVFAWWSKNMNIIKNAMDLVGKPENVILVESAPILDSEIEPSNEYVDKTFTVYHKKDDDAFINCGGRSCVTCQRCYHKETETHVREALK